MRMNVCMYVFVCPVPGCIALGGDCVPPPLNRPFLAPQDISDEHAIQAFKRLDKTDSGTITAKDFTRVMLLLKSHMLTKFVRENLLAVSPEVLLFVYISVNVVCS